MSILTRNINWPCHTLGGFMQKDTLPVVSKNTPQVRIRIGVLQGNTREVVCSALIKEVRSNKCGISKDMCTVEQEMAHREGADIEAMEKNRLLVKYRKQYEKIRPDIKDQCPWIEIQQRLEKNNGYYLTLAKNLAKEGILFGIDEEGNPLFADAGNELPTNKIPPYCIEEMIYSNIRRVLWALGYELFSCKQNLTPPHSNGPEMDMFEHSTKELFIGSQRSSGSAECWLESGSDPQGEIMYAFYNGANGRHGIHEDKLKTETPERFTRRLLRIRKVEDVKRTWDTLKQNGSTEAEVRRIITLALEVSHRNTILCGKLLGIDRQEVGNLIRNYKVNPAYSEIRKALYIY